jgi:hypothetical protein
MRIQIFLIPVPIPSSSSSHCARRDQGMGEAMGSRLNIIHLGVVERVVRSEL